MFTEYAFPGSTILFDPIPNAMLNSIIFKNLGKFRKNTERAAALKFMHAHPDSAADFINPKTLKRKRIPLQQFDEHPEFKKQQVGDNEYVVVY